MTWRQPANKPVAPKPKFETKDDDWETDTSYENNSTEKSQRYGSKSVPGSGRVDHVDLSQVREKMKTVDQAVKTDYKDKNPTRGYGGTYGTEQVMDKAAEGYSYKADVQRHPSQTDGKKGFGGEHGIDERAKDQSAVGFDYKPTVEKHSSQTDYTAGFAGKQETQAEEPEKSTAAPPPTPPPKPAPKPSVAEKPTTPISVKADVGNMRSKFENMRKQQEDEAAQRVADERKKRAANDQKLQQQQSIDDAQKEVKKQEKSPAQPPPSTKPTSKTVENTNTENVDEIEDKTNASSKTNEDESVDNAGDTNE